jgi:hypothetical protein
MAVSNYRKCMKNAPKQQRQFETQQKQYTTVLNSIPKTLSSEHQIKKSK